MSFDSLAQRQKQYEACSDFSLIQRTPVIVRVDGSHFHTLTKNLPKPFCASFQYLMHNVMLYCAPEIQGLVLCYHQSDEITFILRNDQSLEAEPLYNNRIQKIISIIAAKTTLGFNKLLQTIEPKLDLVGEAIFDCRVFLVPDLTEACNNLVWRQQDCMKNSLSGASQAALADKFGKRTALKLLHKKVFSEKKQLLLEQCNIDFDNYYSSAFRRGAIVCKVPTLLPLLGKEEKILRDKWTLNTDLPIFTEDKDYLASILLNRRDIFRGNVK